jgi:type IV secretory pathway TrbD component
MIEVLIGIVILALLIGAERTIALIILALFLILLFNFWYIFLIGWILYCIIKTFKK